MARMIVISIALLTAERCIARVATPSETVNDKLFIALALLAESPAISLDFQPAKVTYCQSRLLSTVRIAIMPPANRRRKDLVSDVRRC